ncbi:MAG: helix-turn-helix domain-containing protein [Rhodocyclaceae bacterium]|nr:helix-turn-helix domain-containing protein [Rhodocyclaceae bacterium]
MVKARLILCRGCMAYLGPLVDNRPHRHHAGQFVQSTGTPFLLHGAQGSRRLHHAALPPDTVHAIDSAGEPVLVLLFEPTILPAAMPDGAPLKPALDCPLNMLGQLRDSSGTPPDARLERLKVLARAAEGPVRLAGLASRVGLSPSRITHLFTRSEGIPFKRWLLWDRLLRTVDRLAAGDDLTTAAHAAGFADSAHFSRSFRAHFGIAASSVFRSRSVQVERCAQH